MRINIGILLLAVTAMGTLQACMHTKGLAYREKAGTPLFQLPDTLWSHRGIDTSIYKTERLHVYEPDIIVTDSFSAVERHTVGYSDGHLFARRNEIVLDLPAIREEAFAFPLPNARLLSPYGRRNGRMHAGMDLKVSRHDTIVAAFDGVVRMAGRSRGYGNVIVIRHFNGLETVYAHNSKHLVRSGDHVSAGTPISISGQTGRATTDHLHFEVRVDGKHIDPRLLIDFDNYGLLDKCVVFSLNGKGKVCVESL